MNKKIASTPNPDCVKNIPNKKTPIKILFLLNRLSNNSMGIREAIYMAKSEG